MAEFCLECFNEEFNKKFKEKEVTLEMDFCEGCAEYKPCVISIYPKNRTVSLFKSIFERIKQKNKQDNN